MFDIDNYAQSQIILNEFLEKCLNEPRLDPWVCSDLPMRWPVPLGRWFSHHFGVRSSLFGQKDFFSPDRHGQKTRAAARISCRAPTPGPTSVKFNFSIQFSRYSSLTACLKAWLLAGIRTRDGKMEIVMALPVAYNLLISCLIWDTFWQPFQGTENQTWALQVSKRASTFYHSCPWPAKKQS